MVSSSALAYGAALFPADRPSVTPAARLQATLDLMHEVDSVARPADAIVSAWFRARRYIQDHDRGHISELLYALLRHHARLGWWLEKHGRQSAPRNRLLAWLALDGGRTADQVHHLFDGGKFAPAVLTDHERVLLVKLQGCAVDHPAMPDEIRGECPSWAIASLRRRFGDAFPREMAALLTAAPLDLRVNPLKATREVVLRALHALGLRAEASRLAPYGIRVNAISPGGFQRGQPEAFIEAYSDACMLGRMGRDGVDLKGAAVFLASDASAYVTGHNLVVDGGFSVWK